MKRETKRLGELDFLRCVMIVLMVVFHLVYFSELHPYAKQVVYTFHMPAFLVISGYLLSADKSPDAFLRSTAWLFVPYAVMEALYAAASTMMPVRGGLEELSVGAMADAIVLHPVGPYWYLHTLILCQLVCYAVKAAVCRLSCVPTATAKVGERGLTGRRQWAVVVGSVLCATIAFCALDVLGGVIVFGNAAYFLIGFAVRQSGIAYTSFVRPSLPAAVPLVVLCCFPECLRAFSPAGMAITYLACSLLLYLYGHLTDGIRRPMLFIGASTLPILLFSPIFTMTCKVLVPWLRFDTTGLLFMVVATCITVGGSLAIARVMDAAGVSKWFCGKHFFA